MRVPYRSLQMLDLKLVGLKVFLSFSRIIAKKISLSGVVKLLGSMLE